MATNEELGCLRVILTFPIAVLAGLSTAVNVGDFLDQWLSWTDIPLAMAFWTFFGIICFTMIWHYLPLMTYDIEYVMQYVAGIILALLVALSLAVDVNNFVYSRINQQTPAVLAACCSFGLYIWTVGLFSIRIQRKPL